MRFNYLIKFSDMNGLELDLSKHNHQAHGQQINTGNVVTGIRDAEVSQISLAPYLKGWSVTEN